MKLYASLYIGSIEVTMKIFEISKNKGLKEIDCIKTQIDLVQDVIKTGSISAETTDRICRILNDMKRIMNGYKVDTFNVYASNHIKETDNELFVLEQIKLRTGFSVQVISNSEHRFLGYEAIASMDKFDDMISESAVLVDVGGASLQITLFSKGKIRTTQHLLFGMVSIGESLRKLESNADSSEQVQQMIQKDFETFETMYLEDKPKYMILLGDQVSLAAFAVSDNIPERMLYDEYIKVLNKINKQLIRESDELNILNDNEDLIDPFVLLYKTMAESIRPDYVVIPGRSVCDGMAYDIAYKKKWLVPPHDFDKDVLSAAWSISKRYSSYQPHLKALEKIATEIFDTTKKYHGMGKRERLLMSTICILHDCGKYISIAGASDCSYTIIMSSEILGLSHIERELIANVVAFNRKPLLPYQELMDIFTEQEYLVMAKLLAILKVANALDRSHKQKLKNVNMYVKDGQLVINIESSASMSLEKGHFSEKADFFERIFALRPVLKEKRLQ